MYRLIVIIIVVFINTGIAYSQENSLDFKTVDYTTYGFYLNNNWDSLIETGNNAIQQNIDYYYLRIRLGIAYYEKQKYFAAATHFEKALQFNSESDLAKEYLYYTYVLSGRETEAGLMSKSFSDTLKNRIGISKFQIISGIYAEGGYIVSNNESKNQHIDFDGWQNIFGEADITKEKYYFNFGLQHTIGKKLSIYHSYNNLSINNTKIVKTFDIIRVTNDYTANQQEYYINANWYMKNNWSLTPAFHYSNLKYRLGDWLSDTVINNYVGSLALSKYIRSSNLSLFATFSDFDTTAQVQAGILITFYPFNNLKFYSTTGLISKNDIGPPPPQSQQGSGRHGNRPMGPEIVSTVVFYQMLGVKLYKNSWLELSATYGDLKNYNEKNASIIYNTPDKINYKLDANLHFQVNKKLRLTLGYQYWDFTGYYSKRMTLLPDDLKTNTTNYQNHLITGGIKWTL